MDFDKNAMKLALEVQELLNMDKPNLTVAFRKGLQLAQMVGDQDVLDWIRKELDGYKGDMSTVPEYRQISIWHTGPNGQPVIYPSEFEQKELLTKMKLSMSVGELQEQTEHDKSLMEVVGSSITEHISKAIRAPARTFYSISSISSVINHITNRLFDFALSINPNPAGSISDDEGIQVQEVGINIGSIQGPVTIGSENVIAQNVSYGEAGSANEILEKLIEMVKSDSELSGEQKEESVAVVEGIQIENEKDRPNRTILKSLTEGFKGWVGNTIKDPKKMQGYVDLLQEAEKMF